MNTGFHMANFKFRINFIIFDTFNPTFFTILMCNMHESLLLFSIPLATCVPCQIFNLYHVRCSYRLRHTFEPLSPCTRIYLTKARYKQTHLGTYIHTYTWATTTSIFTRQGCLIKLYHRDGYALENRVFGEIKSNVNGISPIHELVT